jgi:hypothetical protein
MIITKEEMASASPTIKRQARHEWELDFKVLESVFQARETMHLKLLLEQNVYGDSRYIKLPKFRQVALEAYFRGVVDAVSKMAGVQAPLIAATRPKSSPPKKGKNRQQVSKAPPPLYPSPMAPTSPLPDWARPTIIPPPTLHSPFPPAADLGLGTQ